MRPFWIVLYEAVAFVFSVHEFLQVLKISNITGNIDDPLVIKPIFLLHLLQKFYKQGMVEMQYRNPEALSLLSQSHADCQKALANLNAFRRINFMARALECALLTVAVRYIRETNGLNHQEKPL